jgi:hypothetical protein
MLQLRVSARAGYWPRDLRVRKKAAAYEAEARPAAGAATEPIYTLCGTPQESLMSGPAYLRDTVGAMDSVPVLTHALTAARGLAMPARLGSARPSLCRPSRPEANGRALIGTVHGEGGGTAPVVHEKEDMQRTPCTQSYVSFAASKAPPDRKHPSAAAAQAVLDALQERGVGGGCGQDLPPPIDPDPGPPTRPP